MKIKDYFTPKSMVYSGKHQHKETTFIHYHYKADDIYISHDLQSKDGYKSYIQVIGLTDTKKISAIKETYGIDGFIFEDVFNVTQREKIEVKSDYIFSVVYGLFKKDDHFYKEYMSMISLENVLISFHEDEPWYLDATVIALETYDELRKRSIDFLFYHILDLITDNHIDVYDDLNDRMNQYEEITLSEQILPQDGFFQTRKTLNRLKNNVYYMKTSVESLIGMKNTYIKPENIDYFHDLIDHLNRLDTQINLSKENIRNLVDVNINNQSNKMNKIMTTLTLFSAIFIPLSFLTGFFGMNFVHFGVLDYAYAVWIFIGVCVLVFAFMIWLFKKKDWL